MKTAVTEFRPEPSEAEIQKAAYFLWIELGRPVGHEVETWFAAKEKLRHCHTDSASFLRPAPPHRARGWRTSLPGSIE